MKDTTFPSHSITCEVFESFFYRIPPLLRLQWYVRHAKTDAGQYGALLLGKCLEQTRTALDVWQQEEGCEQFELGEVESWLRSSFLDIIPSISLSPCLLRTVLATSKSPIKKIPRSSGSLSFTTCKECCSLLLIPKLLRGRDL